MFFVGFPIMPCPFNHTPVVDVPNYMSSQTNQIYYHFYIQNEILPFMSQIHYPSKKSILQELLPLWSQTAQSTNIQSLIHRKLKCLQKGIYMHLHVSPINLLIHAPQQPPPIISSTSVNYNFLISPPCLFIKPFIQSPTAHSFSMPHSF